MDALSSNFLIQCLGQGVRDVPDRIGFSRFGRLRLAWCSVADLGLEQQLGCAAQAALLS